MTAQGEIIMNTTKGIIVVFLLLALTNMSFGYYQIMRIAVTALFCFLGYIEWDEKHKLISLLCWISAIVFQPFEKLAFKKSEWHQVDVIFAVLLIIWISIGLSLEKLKKTPK